MLSNLSFALVGEPYWFITGSVGEAGSMKSKQKTEEELLKISLLPSVRLREGRYMFGLGQDRWHELWIQTYINIDD